MLGPFQQPPMPDLMCFPIRMVPKKDSIEMRMIMHLSYPYGNSINDFINEDKASIHYQQFDDAIKLVVKQGRFCWLAKGDLKSVFKLAPIKYDDLVCLGIYFDGQYYVDLTLLFGSAISCAIFEDISSLFHWLFEQITRVQFIHYLDDYLMGHHQLQQCTLAFFTKQAMSNEIGLPLSPEKLVPPTQCLNFLGLGIDTIRMVITVPEDKKKDIIACLQSALHAKKPWAKQLQSLAGKLNFITKAVPPGRTFSARIYWAFKNVQPNWHISVTKEMHKDLQMWIVFLQEFGGCTPILMEI